MEPNSSGDLQYDEAHEAVMQGCVNDAPASQDEGEHLPPHSCMPSAQPDGDYSYDMSHDAVRPATNDR